MQFNKYHSFQELDKSAFEKLVESGFGKKLKDNYFDYSTPEYIIIAEEQGYYHGGIVVENIDGIHYLDKIVVAHEYQNSGLGKKLWGMMNGDSDKLVWRAKQDNKITKFYEEQCEGKQKHPPWIIYWYGLDTSELEKGINYALNKEETLEVLI